MLLKPTTFVQLVRRKNFLLSLLSLLLIISFQTAYSQESSDWLHYKPKQSAQAAKKVVLISGDEEYRSEETLPMLAKILTTHHSFETVVLFAIDPKTKIIDPNNQNNIPGLHHLADADLMIIATRFRELPDQQMKHIDDYLTKGKPVIGLRTATHAFNYAKDNTSPYRHYSFNHKGGAWDGGFGRLVLGETWINHHGDHGKEGTRGLINGLEVVNKNPILQGVTDIWGPTDVYGIHTQLKEATILVYGQSTDGMTAQSPISWKKTILPVAWTKPYKIPNGTTGKVFATTMGAATDFVSDDFRRLIINACLWSLDLSHLITAETNIEYIAPYTPTMFGFGDFKKGLKPKDYQ